jgi:hypothetical protein
MSDSVDTVAVYHQYDHIATVYEKPDSHVTSEGQGERVTESWKPRPLTRPDDWQLQIPQQTTAKVNLTVFPLFHFHFGSMSY